MDLPADDRTDESSLTPWDTMDPDEPAAVSLVAPYPADDPGEALVYCAPEMADTPAVDPMPVSEEQAGSPERARSPETSVEEARPSAAPVITEASVAESLGDPEGPATPSGPLLRYSGGGLGWGPFANGAPSTQPPPQPSPGVPEEGQEVRAGSDLTEAGQSTIVNPPSSQLNILVDEQIEEDITAQQRDEELDQVCEDPELDHEPEPVLTGATWTIPMLCAGIGLIACCIIIPQADSNRRLAYEKQMLQADLESVQRQVTVNGEFLNRVVDDPALSERLAQRQLKRVRKGQRVLQLKEDTPEMSPFQITNIAPPAAPPPYKPVGGIIAGLCYDARTRLYLMGVALTMIAGGLVLGSGVRQPRS